MKTLKRIILAGLIGAFVTLSLAADHDMTDGEVKKIDRDNQKLTIKHGPIKNLDMPGMTMVFKVKDPTLVDRVKVGDKVRFVVENSPSGLVVIELVPAGK